MTALWAAKAPHPDWAIKVGPDPAPLLAEILNCHQAWRWLTRPQRHALLAHTAGDRVSAHPRVLAALTKHGLVDGNELTEAGRLVRKWNQPTLPATPDQAAVTP